MAVFEDVDQNLGAALTSLVTRVGQTIVLVLVLAGPIILGGFLGHVTTDRLVDPEAVLIETHLPKSATGGVSTELVGQGARATAPGD